jgi:uncharacterized integral membrane protein
MATFEESFLYPLILLLIGALISGVLVAKLTNRWENNKKIREEKTREVRFVVVVDTLL